MITLAIAGFGNIGKVHLQNLASLRGCSVAGIFDVDPAALAQAPETVRKYASLDALTADAAIDAVVIATGTDSHRQIAELCFAAGKHVFVEKPLAGTLVDAQEIVDAGQRSGRVAQAGFCERFNPQYLEAKRAVASGRLGNVRAVQSSRVAPYSLSNPAWDLGVLDTAVHNIDLILWMTGRLPETVQAWGTQVYPDSAGPHSVTILLRFADGAYATDHIAWIKDDEHPLHRCARSQMRILGGARHVRYRSDIAPVEPSHPRWLCSNRHCDTGRTRLLRLPEAAIRSILSKHRGKRACSSPLSDALRAERVVLAAAESLQSGREVGLQA